MQYPPPRAFFIHFTVISSRFYFETTQDEQEGIPDGLMRKQIMSLIHTLKKKNVTERLWDVAVDSENGIRTDLAYPQTFESLRGLKVDRVFACLSKTKNTSFLIYNNWFIRAAATAGIEKRKKKKSLNLKTKPGKHQNAELDWEKLFPDVVFSLVIIENQKNDIRRTWCLRERERERRRGIS